MRPDFTRRRKKRRRINKTKTGYWSYDDPQNYEHRYPVKPRKNK